MQGEAAPTQACRDLGFLSSTHFQHASHRVGWNPPGDGNVNSVSHGLSSTPSLRHHTGPPRRPSIPVTPIPSFCCCQQSPGAQGGLQLYEEEGGYEVLVILPHLPGADGSCAPLLSAVHFPSEGDTLVSLNPQPAFLPKHLGRVAHPVYQAAFLIPTQPDQPIFLEFTPGDITFKKQQSWKLTDQFYACLQKWRAHSGAWDRSR